MILAFFKKHMIHNHEPPMCSNRKCLSVFLKADDFFGWIAFEKYVMLEFGVSAICDNNK